jgi:hypothetical protein
VATTSVFESCRIGGVMVTITVLPSDTDLARVGCRRLTSATAVPSKRERGSFTPRNVTAHSPWRGLLEIWALTDRSCSALSTIYTRRGWLLSSPIRIVSGAADRSDREGKARL